MTKTNTLGFRPGPTQTGLYSHRSRLKTRNFGLKKKDCTIRAAKNKGADQLCSYCTADLRLCFRICKLLVFSCGSSFLLRWCHSTFDIFENAGGKQPDDLNQLNTENTNCLKDLATAKTDDEGFGVSEKTNFKR